MRFTILFLFLLVFSRKSSAQNDFANCNQISKVHDSLKQPLSDDARIETLEIILIDMQNLTRESQRSNSEHPKNLLKQCFTKKKESFESQVVMGSETLRSSPRYFKLLANYSLLVSRYEDAYKYFLRVSEKYPNDFDPRLKAFDAWLSWKSTVFRTLDPSILTESDLNKLLSESDSLLSPIINNNSTPTDIKVKSLSTRATLIESVTGKASQSVSDWKKIIELSPQNLEALQKVVAYELSRKNLAEAKPYLLKLGALTPRNIEVQRNLLEAFYQEQDFELAREWAKKFLLIQQSDSVVMSFASWAFFESQDLSNARKWATKALKGDSSNKIARKVLSRVFNQEGEKALSELQVTKAIGFFEKSLKTDPNQSPLLKRLAFLIYETTQKQKSLSSKAKSKDMKRVSELLSKYIDLEVPDSSILATLIEASLIAGSYQIGAKACQKHIDDFGLLPSHQTVLNCSEHLVSTNKTSEAKKLLEEALQTSKYSGNKSELSAALVKLVQTKAEH
jgi:tetratricopeptide (TPR) repeat protein